MNKTFDRVFAEIIAEMENGNTPWQKGWKMHGGESPRNAATRRPYSGGNVLALCFASAKKGYTDCGWITFRQALAAGCVVRKGEKSTTIFYMATMSKESANVGEKPDSIFFAKSFHVFNVEQLDELEAGALAKLRQVAIEPMTDFERNEAAEEIITRSGATIVTGNPAYIRSLDLVTMPPKEGFTSPAEYYSAAFHELVHWTGHESRLSRKLHNRKGDADYAFEELVAELGAAFMGGTLGMALVSQSAAYLKSWTAACKANPAILARAAALASKAANLLMPTTGTEESATVDNEACAL